MKTRPRRSLDEAPSQVNLRGSTSEDARAYIPKMGLGGCFSFVEWSFLLCGVA